MESTISDAVLLDRWARAQDAQAFRELVARHSALVFAASRRILRRADQAEDVAQECFLELARAREPERLRLPAWLHRVAVNRSLSRLRAEAGRRRTEANWARARREPRNPEWEEIEGLVDEAIARLPAKIGGPVVRHFLEGHTLDEVAGELGVSRSTLTYRIQTGIRSIRSHLRRRGFDAAPAVLAGWLAGRTAEAAPASLTAALGKLALAGPPALRGPSVISGEAGGLILGGLMKTKLAVVAAVLLAATAIFLTVRPGAGPEGASPEPGPLVRAPAPPAETAGPETGQPASKTIAPATPPAPPPAEPELLASIAGTVVDEDGMPVAGAAVFLLVHAPAERGTLADGELSRSRWFAGRADADGRFLLGKIGLEGQALLGASQEGYAGGVNWITLERGGSLADQVITLAPGQELRGVVLGPDGKPLADALVTAYHAWNEREYASSPEIAATGPDGKFRLGLHAKAERATFRVASASAGQCFFQDRLLDGAEVQLKMEPAARVRGSISWDDGSPAEGLVVNVEGQVPDPKVLASRLGLRPRQSKEARVDSDGRYEVLGLLAGLTYDIYVTAGGEDRNQDRLHPLTPRWKNELKPAPGEVLTWDARVANPIVLRGRVVTEGTRTPVPRLMIGVKKDGKPLQDSHHQTDQEGAFRLLLNGGPGAYLVFAQPSYGFDKVGELMAERFGKQLQLRGGEELEVELEVFEPVVLPLRAVDADGRPVKNIGHQVSLQLEGGERYGLGDSSALDEEGRTALRFYFPLKKLSLEVCAFPEGPKVKFGPFTPAPGETVPETLVTLPRTCELRAVLVDPSGNPHREAQVLIEGHYAGKIRESFYSRTDRDGAFSKTGCIRAAPLTLTLTLQGSSEPWKSVPLDASASALLDLGRLAIP